MFKIISTIILVLVGNYWMSNISKSSEIVKSKISKPQSIVLKKSDEQGFDLLKKESQFILQANHFSGGTYQKSLVFEKGNLVTFANGNIKAGGFTLDMNSLKNAGCQASEMSQKAEKYLISEDFLAVQQFPKAEFIIQSVTPVIEMFDYKSMLIEGVLTIKGVGKTISFMATTTRSNHVVKLEGQFNIDFKKWGIYSSKLDENGNSVLANEIKINLNLAFSPGC